VAAGPGVRRRRPSPGNPPVARGCLVLLAGAEALGTALLLTDAEITVVGDLREHARGSSAWIVGIGSVVRRAFAEPDVPAHPGWEPLAACRRRVVAAVEEILRAPPDLLVIGGGAAGSAAGP
jgi:broad specificity phosphatase PhoE